MESESPIVAVEFPPFSAGEKIPLKGRWFIVAKVGLTENGVPGVVLEMAGKTKQGRRRERDRTAKAR